MSEQFRKVGSALSLCLLMAACGTAMADSSIVDGHVPPRANIVTQHEEASPCLAASVARPLAVFGASGRGAYLFARASRPQQSAVKAKNYALLLSSLGMLGVIAVHRLGRML